MSFWLTVAGMVAVTFGSRYAGVALRTDLPDFWGRFLHFVPIAVFASLVTPYLEGDRNEWGSGCRRGSGRRCGVEDASAVGRDRGRDERFLAATHPVLTPREPATPLAADGGEFRCPEHPPSRSANDRSNPPARKIHASASGSRSAGIAPSA